MNPVSGPGGKRAAVFILSLLACVFAFIAWRFFISRGGTYVEPGRMPVVDAVYALGTVKADKIFTLRLTVNAQLSRVYVSEGQAVGAGARLVMTDSGALLSAPFGGTISRLYYRQGESAVATQPVLTLVDTSGIYVLLSLDQDDVIRVRKGQKVELSFENLRERKIPGSVDLVYPSEGEFLVKIKTPSLPAGVLPDMTVDAAIAVGVRESACIVPSGAVKDGSVMLAGKNGMRAEKVLHGMLDGGWFEVPCGNIREGERVFVPRGGW